MKTFYSFLIVLLFSGAMHFAQPKSNLERILETLELGISKAESNFSKEGNTPVFVSTAPKLEILKPKLSEIVLRKGYSLSSERNSSQNQINLSLLDVNVQYTEAQKDGFFSDIKVNRIISVTGTMERSLPDGKINARSLDADLQDVISLNEIKNVEDGEFPFTQAPAPQIPFLSNLLEPVLVVGTLVVTVLLLFLVRSK